MKIKFLIVGLLSLILVLALVIAAKPNTTLVPAINNKANVPVIIPVRAVEVANGVFSLGTSQDVDGRKVEGFLFISKKEDAKPPWAGKGKGGGNKCYALFAKGARWKTTEQYITGNGIDTAITETSLDTWDSETSFNIFGTRNLNGSIDGADDVSPDGKNEVMFENLGSGNTIAYTIVWGIFSGKPNQRELVEWDVVFNTAYNFGDADAEPSVMDYQNIATHEFGHTLGLAHPEDSCTEETMYRFAEYGETKKRTLNSGDLAGLQKLYG